MPTKSTAKRFPERFGIYLSPSDATALRALMRRTDKSASELMRLALDVLLADPDPFLVPNYDRIRETASRQAREREAVPA